MVTKKKDRQTITQTTLQRVTNFRAFLEQSPNTNSKQGKDFSAARRIRSEQFHTVERFSMHMGHHADEIADGHRLETFGMIRCCRVRNCCLWLKRRCFSRNCQLCRETNTRSSPRSFRLLTGRPP